MAAVVGAQSEGLGLKSTGAQVTLLQRQQTAASAPFQTLCGHFSLTVAEKNCGGWERRR